MNLKELRELTRDFSVLYVEDDIEIKETMTHYLEKFFLSVVSALDGKEGLAFYAAQKFDIVITDLSMPRVNGLDMLTKIKEINPTQATIITTAHSESEYMVTAIKLGVDGYVIKPFDFKQLNAELYKVAEKLKKYKENEEYKLHLEEMVNEKTSQLREFVKVQEDNYEKTLLSMVEMIEERDTYTAGHSRRVAEYCRSIAKEMGYSKEDVTKIYRAGILHDVGKIATPDTVLLNPQHLNEIEYKLIQEHVEVSYKLLSHIPMFKDLSEIVYSHHERYDGTGYPNGLKASEIPPLGRIMIVADAFDAMTTNRIYKARKSVEEAFIELTELKLKQFHPEVVDSAIVALKDVQIDQSIDQLPNTKLEEERFAYFYKDSLSNLYNKSYLDVILLKNSYTNDFSNMHIFYLKDFSKYNGKYGWSDGDKLLSQIAQFLYEYFEDSLVFRIYGDDFVSLSKKHYDLEKLEVRLTSMLEDTGVTYFIKSVNLNEVCVKNITDIRRN